MTTNKTETTITKQRIFIQGVEHSFRVGEKAGSPPSLNHS